MQQTWWQFLRSWAAIGLQSFGGGATTLFLMRKVATEDHQWVTADEFSQYWGIVQIAPGINLLGQAILIGARVAGIRGALVALFGLLLPSVSITIALTAGYTVIRALPWVQAFVAGVIPATVGLGLTLVYQMVSPQLQRGHQAGWPVTALNIAVVAVGLGVTALTTIPSLVTLWGAAVFSALGYWALQRRGVQS